MLPSRVIFIARDCIVDSIAIYIYMYVYEYKIFRFSRLERMKKKNGNNNENRCFADFIDKFVYSSSTKYLVMNE